MWANPYVLHTAINDYASYRRVMYRTTIEGPTVQARRRMQEFGRASGRLNAPRFARA